MRDLTLERLLDVLNYDSINGEFTWKTSKSRSVKCGMKAGSLNSYGYVRIGIDGTYYFAHRLVWMCENGTMPLSILDHKNRIKTDNRISNLREVTSQVNAENTVNTGNLTGCRGVFYYKGRRKPYRVVISVNKKIISLGYFADKESAKNAYMNAKEKFHDGYFY